MDACEIFTVAGTWVYRAIVQVDGQRSSGDAEICWQASADSSHVLHPISCAQREAVGNALALAGFGDVRGILQRQGKAIPLLDAPPQLASAEVAQRVHQGHRLLLQGTPGNAAALKTSEQRDAATLMTDEQRQQLGALCERLGRAQPDWFQLNASLAEALLVSLHAEEAELLQAADAALGATPTAPREESAPASDLPVEASLVRALKQRWRTLVGPTGTTAGLQGQWKAFKVRVCGCEVSDSAMRRAQYTRLVQALDHLSPLDAPSDEPASPSRPSPSTPIRQAPRLAVSLPKSQEGSLHG
jgi:hypothetical protein